MHLILPPNSPVQQLSVHLDVARTLRPPPLAPALPSLVSLYLLPRSLLDPGVTCRMPVDSVSLVRSPPFVTVGLCPGPCQRLGVIPYKGTSLPLPISATLIYALYPCCPRPVDQSPTGVEGFLLCSLCSPFICASASPSLFSLCLLMYYGAWCLLWVLFCTRARGQGASTTWRSLDQALDPVLLRHAGAVQDTPLFSPLSLRPHLLS